MLAGAFSVFTLVSGGAGPILGALADRFGPRQLILAGGALLAAALWADSFVTRAWHLYLAFGLLTAVGVATAGWTPAVVMVQRHFSSRLGLALGIAGSGVGLGIFLVVPLCQALIDAFGWRWAFRALGALAALWILPATFLAIRDAPPAPRAVVTSTEPAPGGHSLARALDTCSFRLIGLAVFLGSICSQTLHVHQAAFLVDHGLSAMTAASVISVVGAASILGKTGGGWISDLFSRELVYALGMVGMIIGLGVLWVVALAPSAWLALGYAVLFGVGYSVTAFIVPAMMSDRFRGPHFGSIFGAPGGERARQRPGRVAGRVDLRRDGELRDRVHDRRRGGGGGRVVGVGEPGAPARLRAHVANGRGRARAGVGGAGAAALAQDRGAPGPAWRIFGKDARGIRDLGRAHAGRGGDALWRRYLGGGWGGRYQRGGGRRGFGGGDG